MKTSVNRPLSSSPCQQERAVSVQQFYDRYGGMIWTCVLKFIPDPEAAKAAYTDVFRELSGRLQEASTAPLGIYAWLQQEARRIILKKHKEKIPAWEDFEEKRFRHPDMSCFFEILKTASNEHQLVFRELYLYGKEREKLAATMGIPVSQISLLLRESLSFIRKHQS